MFSSNIMNYCLSLDKCKCVNICLFCHDIRLFTQNFKLPHKVLIIISFLGVLVHGRDIQHNVCTTAMTSIHESGYFQIKFISVTIG